MREQCDGTFESTSHVADHMKVMTVSIAMKKRFCDCALRSTRITCAISQEIHVDELGRVKIRFAWDRSGITDDKSSYWVRCLQMGMGGSMLLPRMGWEVPVGYIDGDPDRPFVLGRIYNGKHWVPVDAAAEAARAWLRSDTTAVNQPQAYASANSGR